MPRFRKTDTSPANRARPAHVIIVLLVSLRTVSETGSDFRRMKSRARFASYRVSGPDFVKTLRSRSRIFKKGTRRLGKSRILSFATPLQGSLFLKFNPFNQEVKTGKGS